MMHIVVPGIKKWLDWVRRWFTRPQITKITIEKTFLKTEEAPPKRKYKKRAPNNPMKVRRVYRKRKSKGA